MKINNAFAVLVQLAIATSVLLTFDAAAQAENCTPDASKPWFCDRASLGLPPMLSSYGYGTTAGGGYSRLYTDDSGHEYEVASIGFGINANASNTDDILVRVVGPTPNIQNLPAPGYPANPIDSDMPGIGAHHWGDASYLPSLDALWFSRYPFQSATTTLDGRGTDFGTGINNTEYGPYYNPSTTAGGKQAVFQLAPGQSESLSTDVALAKDWRHINATGLRAGCVPFIVENASPFAVTGSGETLFTSSHQATGIPTHAGACAIPTTDVALSVAAPADVTVGDPVEIVYSYRKSFSVAKDNVFATQLPPLQDRAVDIAAGWTCTTDASDFLMCSREYIDAGPFGTRLLTITGTTATVGTLDVDGLIEVNPFDQNPDNNSASASIRVRAVATPPPVMVPINSPGALLALLGLLGLTALLAFPSTPTRS